MLHAALRAWGLARRAATVPLLAYVVAVLGRAAVPAVAATLPHLQQYWQNEIERCATTAAQDELFRAVERFGGLARFESPTFLDRLRLATHAGEQTATGVSRGAR